MLSLVADRYLPEVMWPESNQLSNQVRVGVSLCQCVGLAFCIRARIFRLVGIGSKLFFFQLSMFQFMLNTILGNEM